MNKMKYSWVWWIWNIPESWKVERCKYHFSNNKYVPWVNSVKYERLSLTLKWVVKRSKEDADWLQPKDFDNYQLLRKNELVFKLIDLQNVSTSRVWLSPYEWIVSPAYIILHGKGSILPKFAEKYFLMMWYREIFNALWDEWVRSNLSATDLLNFPICFPDKNIQEKISNFLDKKLWEINSLYSDIELQIERLEEYKKSVITECVTKWLNLHVELKSFKDKRYWFIPKHWEVLKSLYILSQPITDWPHTTPDLYDEWIPFVSAEAISFWRWWIDFNHIRWYISEDFYKVCCRKYTPKVNDVYLIKSWATTWKVSIVQTDKIFTIWSPLAVFRCNEKKMKPKYLYYCLQWHPFQNQIQDWWTYWTQQNIWMRTLEHLKVSKPPIEEQDEIVRYLDNKCWEIEDIIEKKEKQLEILDQYKKSLIYEYVTGKKEVPSNY